jgi:hypothetical protein
MMTETMQGEGSIVVEGKPRPRGRPRTKPRMVVEDKRALKFAKDQAKPKVRKPKLHKYHDHPLAKIVGEDNVGELSELVKKFEQQYGCKLTLAERFYAYKCYIGNTHRDWISINGLINKYSSRIPQITVSHPKCQRPYTNNRIY